VLDGFRLARLAFASISGSAQFAFHFTGESPIQ
jgi:hypothetical protein